MKLQQANSSLGTLITDAGPIGEGWPDNARFQPVSRWFCCTSGSPCSDRENHSPFCRRGAQRALVGCHCWFSTRKPFSVLKLSIWKWPKAQGNSGIPWVKHRQNVSNEGSVNCKWTKIPSPFGGSVIKPPLSSTSTERHLSLCEHRHPAHLVLPWPHGPVASGPTHSPGWSTAAFCMLSLWLHRAPFSSPSNWAPSTAHGSCTHPSLCPSSLLVPVLRALSVIPQAGSKPHSDQPSCVNGGHTPLLF